MSKNNISELDVVAANNADLAGISILATGLLSTADDSFRTAASFLAKWWEDLGGVNTVGGTGDAITVTTSTIYTALKTGMRLQFIASAANTTAATLNLDAIGAKALRKISGGTDVALVAGDIPGAKFRVEVGYDAAANSAAGAWIVLGAAPVSSATTSAQGIVELATVAEAATGTDAVRAVTPAGLYYPTGHLFGLTLSNNASDATNDIDIAAGSARSADDTANMVLASALGKQLDVAWAVGGTPASSKGGLDTGSVGNNTYYIWLIKRSDTGVVDALFSLSATAPTMPTSYDLKALIGSFARVGGVNQVPRGYSRQADLADGEFRSETPVFTQLGTVTGPNIRCRRVGDCLQGYGLYTTGTVGGGEPRISLLFNGKPVVVDSAKVSAVQMVGKHARNTAGGWNFSTLVNGGNGYINLGSGTVSLTQVITVASTYLSNTEQQDFDFLVPILGWAKP